MPAWGVDVSAAVAAATVVVPVVSVAPAAASDPPARVVAEAAAVSGVEAPDSDAGHVTIPPPAGFAPLSHARAAREGCGVLLAPSLGLLLGWPSAVAVRAQCVASALWKVARPVGPQAGPPPRPLVERLSEGLDRPAPLVGEPEGGEVGGMPSRLGRHARPLTEIEAG